MPDRSARCEAGVPAAGGKREQNWRFTYGRSSGHQDKRDQRSRSGAAEPEESSLAGLWWARSCLCSLQTLLAALATALATGRNQGSTCQWLHAGVLVVNLMARYRENKPRFLISACNFHFVSPEHVCSILASLLRNLRGQQRTRLLNKFTENDSEKVSAEYVSAVAGCPAGR